MCCRVSPPTPRPWRTKHRLPDLGLPAAGRPHEWEPAFGQLGLEPRLLQQRGTGERGCYFTSGVSRRWLCPSGQSQCGEERPRPLAVSFLVPLVGRRAGSQVELLWSTADLHLCDPSWIAVPRPPEWLGRESDLTWGGEGPGELGGASEGVAGGAPLSCWRMEAFRAAGVSGSFPLHSW